MPEVTDPRVLSKLNQRPVAAPEITMGPSSQPPVYEIPIPASRQQTMDIQAQDAEIRRRKAQMDEQLAELERQQREAKMRSLNATGGFDPQIDENQAAFHALNIANKIPQYKTAIMKDPEAAKPGLLESTIGGVLPEQFKGITQSEQRQLAAEAVSSMLESLVYLNTGAAASEPQRESYRASITPTISDEPALLEAKRKNAIVALHGALLRAGPNRSRVAQALEEIQLNSLYPGTQQTPAEKQMLDLIRWQAQNPELELKSSDSRTKPYPGAAQYAYIEKLSAIPQGKLTVEAYRQLRSEIDKEFLGQESAYDPIEAAKFVEGYNKGKFTYPLPPIPVGEANKVQEIGKEVSDLPVLGPAATGYANSATLGLFGGQNRENLEELRKQNPGAFLAGDVAGSVIPTTGLETLAGRGILKAFPHLAGETSSAVGREVLGNAAYSGARGFNEAKEGEGGKEAVIQAMLGAAMVPVARTITSGSRSMLPRGKQEAINEILDKGGDLTTLHRAGVSNVEETLRNVPFVRGALEKEANSLNIMQANEALAPVGLKLPKGTKPGTDANAKVHDLLNAEYEKIKPQIKGKVDDVFFERLNVLKAQLSPGVERTLFKQIENIQKKFSKRTGYDGAAYKEANEGLRALSDGWAAVTAETSPQNFMQFQKLGKIADQVRGEIKAQVGRATPEVKETLDNIDKGWGIKLATEDATRRALASTPGGVYSPGQKITTIKTQDISRNKGASARGRARGQKAATDLQEIVGSKSVPENVGLYQSGIATMAPAVAMGTDSKGGKLAGALISLGGTALYTPGVRQVVSALVTGRRVNPKSPKVVQMLGKAVDNKLVRAALNDYLREKAKGN